MLNTQILEILEMENNPISKNQDLTRLVNFRLRKSDLDALDKWCQKHHWSRTKGLEVIIKLLPNYDDNNSTE